MRLLSEGPHWVQHVVGRRGRRPDESMHVREGILGGLDPKHLLHSLDFGDKPGHFDRTGRAYNDAASAACQPYDSSSKLHNARSSTAADVDRGQLLGYRRGSNE